MAEKSLVIVALPKASDPVHTIGSEEKHATLLYLGSDVDRVAFELVKASVLASIKSFRFTESVSRVATLGDDGARVWMIDSDNGLRRWRERFLGMPAIRALYDSIEQYPTYTPHVTIGYPTQGQDKLDGIVESLALTVDKIKFDRIAVWYGEDHDSIYRLHDDDELSDAVEASHADLDNFLAHYGVKGMRWGVRRSDAQLGRARRGGKKGSSSDGDNDSATSRSDAKKAAAAKDAFISADAERFIKTRQKEGHEMSDREIREALNRAKMVKEYDEMFGDSPNSQLKQKVESLRLQKEYAQLKGEMNPSMVKRFVSTMNSGYNAYSKLDKATDGALNDQLAKTLGLKSGYKPKHAKGRKK